MDHNNLTKLAKLIRYLILTSTTEAGSGHPTTSLSATDLMTVLFFDGYFRFFVDNPKHPNNDRLLFSKGHGSPLFYALWAATGAFPVEDLMTLRRFGSPLEGHPMPAFPFTEAATGSLGQGLSIGVGMALNGKYLDRLPYKTYVLLGDSEMMEGSVWEAAALATHYKLDNLIAILDVNRLGQAGPTMHGWNTSVYQKKFEAFGWDTVVIDGHNYDEIVQSFAKAHKARNKPFVIIAKTVKGRGVSSVEDKMGHHGVPLNQDELKRALSDLGDVDHKIRGSLKTPQDLKPKKPKSATAKPVSHPKDTKLATRKAYGSGLARIGKKYPHIISLDAETKNSTYSEKFEKAYPDRFFEMYIGEQNMAGVALGLSLRGKIPFASTFAAFWTRAFDQIRMSQYSNANVKFCGSHAGVSIGEDGPSQMGLEDLALFGSILDSVILYPSDAVATEKLVEQAAKHNGIVYLRTTRSDTPILYKSSEEFAIGGSKTIRSSKKDVATVVAAGITLHEALKAYDELTKNGVNIRVIDAYSVKPIDKKTLMKAHDETKAIITVEDHHPHGGLGTAVNNALAAVKNRKPVYILAVRKTPKSGTPGELLHFEGIDAAAIVERITNLTHLGSGMEQPDAL